jgi:DNA-binding Lrp family transcriptional regulator
MEMRKLSMRKIIEVLRPKFRHPMSNQQIAKSCSLSRTTVPDYLDRMLLAGLLWALDPALDNATLDGMLFPHNAPLPSADRGMYPVEYLFNELKRKRVTIDDHELFSTIVATQLPISNWHDNIKDPTIADAILDRLIHNAHKIILKGESMTKIRSTFPNWNNSEK